MALNIRSSSSPASPHHIAAYFHHFPFGECAKERKKNAHVHAYGCQAAGRVRVRCKCADTQLPRRRWGEERGSARAGKGVNWAVIVQEAGYDWVKWQDLVRATWGTLTTFCSFYLPSITLFFVCGCPSFHLGLSLWNVMLSVSLSHEHYLSPVPVS